MKARQAAREVIATYSVDDIFIELVIQLPQNHPLGSIAVESGRRVGVAVQQWRNWMLQLSTYLTHQVRRDQELLGGFLIQMKETPLMSGFYLIFVKNTFVCIF